MPSSPRVLHILNELRPSGAEMMLHAAAAFWAARGIQSEILSTGLEPGPFAPLLEERGYKIHHAPFSKSLAFFWGVYRLLRSGGYQAVHIHTERGGFWYSLLARLSGHRRIVRTFHNVFRFTGLRRAERKFQRFVMRRWIGVSMVAIGRSVRDTEQSVFGNTCSLIPNWFDTSKFMPPEESERRTTRRELQIPEGVIVITTVGNCNRLKNHGVLIEAVSRLAASHRILYVHAGQEEPGQPERGLSVRYNLGDRIRFAGAGLNIPALLRASDIFVMPSLHEGFSIAVLEAMAAGLPVVLTDVPGLRDLREFSNQIRWADPVAASLHLALQDLCSMNEPARRQIGVELSRAVHSNFGVEKGAGLYLSLYKNGAAQQDCGWQSDRLKVPDSLSTWPGAGSI